MDASDTSASPAVSGPTLLELTEVSLDSGSPLADALCDRLRSAPDARSAVPALKCIRHVCREGSRDFRRRLRELDEHLRARTSGEAGKIVEVLASKVFKSCIRIPRPLNASGYPIPPVFGRVHHSRRVHLTRAAARRKDVTPRHGSRCRRRRELRRFRKVSDKER